MPVQVDRLRQLGADFAALKDSVTALEAHPGADLLVQLSPKIDQAHQLITRTLQGLSDLSTSQYIAIPGSRAALDTLCGVVESASLAAAELASAVAENPLDAAGFAGGSPQDTDAVRKARHTSAVPVLAEALTRAAQCLDLSGTGCRSTASGIIRDLAKSPDYLASLPRLTPAQYTALEKIAQGGASFFGSLRSDRNTIRAGDGSTLHAKPFDVLTKNQLVRFRGRGSSLGGQDITVTAAGRLALTAQKPPAQPASAQTLTASVTAGTPRKRR
ncbi:hypothetical protein OG288_37045 [Streptomyces tauricus]|uniref:Uncharacterized protein n=1 Tax=Streptomyces tauricus TaxID=68274 RepID=A0ABZ1JQW3_9ACTN|nr:hypothetical protein [Streptomyces tauricus]